jgi:hypothetical protein
VLFGTFPSKSLLIVRAVLGASNERSAQWLITCTWGWTTRTPSHVAADAAVLVHRREPSQAREHVVAYPRFEGRSPEEQPWPERRLR